MSKRKVYKCDFDGCEYTGTSGNLKPHKMTQKNV